mmetsp:Transcript_93035/g.139641  ORF Transcript_93035/g.139641 Transcript_93035/m.139641 type:complete len:264 (+) Transcript_93035:65-856(+)
MVHFDNSPFVCFSELSTYKTLSAVKATILWSKLAIWEGLFASGTNKTSGMVCPFFLNNNFTISNRFIASRTIFFVLTNQFCIVILTINFSFMLFVFITLDWRLALNTTKTITMIEFSLCFSELNPRSNRFSAFTTNNCFLNNFSTIIAMNNSTKFLVSSMNGHTANIAFNTGSLSFDSGFLLKSFTQSSFFFCSSFFFSSLCIFCFLLFKFFVLISRLSLNILLFQSFRAITTMRFILNRKQFTRHCFFTSETFNASNMPSSS